MRETIEMIQEQFRTEPPLIIDVEKAQVGNNNDYNISWKF